MNGIWYTTCQATQNTKVTGIAPPGTYARAKFKKFRDENMANPYLKFTV